MFPLTQVPLFSWLLKEYGPCDYSGESGTTYLLSITIGGMLYDLKCRAENDAIARLVLEFLSQPYIKDIHSRSADHPWFTRCGQYLSKFFFPKKTELSFSEKMASLGGSPYTEEQGRNKRLITLKEKGYSYKKDYDFISCEPGENGKERSVSFDEVVLPTKKIEKLIYADYPVLKGSCDKSALTTGMKAATLLTAGLSLFPVASALMPPTPPLSQNEVNNVCNPYNTYTLFEAGFAESLRRNPTDCFTLGTNITLTQLHSLPVFKNCDTPFSGIFNTGGYTIRAENEARSIFGCIDQATVTGHFDFCTDNNRYTPPLIAEKVLNGSIISIQQAKNCTIQRPMFGDIVGDNNQITFSGESKEIRVKSDTGIIATHVLGNNNMITARQAQLHDSPIVFTAGGHNNTYHQQSMNITRFTGRNPPDNKLLIASNFAGGGTNIIQNNIKAKLLTRNTYTSNHGISNARNEIAGIFSSNLDINIKTLPPLQNEIRLTNISDNSEQRAVVANHGRFEIFKDNYWQSICEDTFYQRTAHAACKALGFREAESEGERLSLKERLSATKLTSLPVHLKKRCTGYERDLNDCRTESNNRVCPENSEAFLSCSHNDTAPVRNSSAYLRLTDYTSNHSERFDTTNTGTGRLEFIAKSGSDISKVTLCKLGFSAQSTENACNSMGFDGGEQIHPSSVISLDQDTPQYRIHALHTEGTKVVLSINHNAGNCTRDKDVVLRCNRKIAPGLNVLLTDRHSNDTYRANVSSTGFGRLEIHHATKKIKSWRALRPESLSNNAATVVCKRLGFKNGMISHLTANSTIKTSVSTSFVRRRLFTVVEELVLDCKLRRDSLESCVKLEDFVTAPVTNAVLLCNKKSGEEIRISQKACLASNQKNTIFSGSYNAADDCMTVQCPVILWDINSVKLSDNIVSQCLSQQLDTTNREDWLTMWNARCKHSSDHCSCHLPHGKLLGFVTKDPQHDEAYLISRQTYPNNKTANAKGLVLVSRLFSNEIPRVLNPANEVLETEQLPVKHIINEQYLMGVYPASNDGNIQLFMTSLEHGSNTYRAQTYDLGGKALLLTSDTIFIKNTDKPEIISYQLNLIMNDSITFNLIELPSKHITLPENTANAFTAVLKNNWFHVAATNKNDTGNIYVISYNIAGNSWDPDWRRVDGLTPNNITNYNMVINSCSQIQFLSNDQIMSTNPVSVSIPEFGGCLSFSKVKEAEEFKVTVPAIQPAPAEIVSELPSMSTGLTSEISSTNTEITEETPSVTLEPENTDDVKSNNKLILAVAITTPVVCIAGMVVCCYCYNCNKINDHLCKTKDKNEVSCKHDELEANPFGSIREHTANQQEEEYTANQQEEEYTANQQEEEHTANQQEEEHTANQ